MREADEVNFWWQGANVLMHSGVACIGGMGSDLFFSVVILRCHFEII